jgi:hypothetical protein
LRNERRKRRRRKFATGSNSNVKSPDFADFVKTEDTLNK